MRAHSRIPSRDAQIAGVSRMAKGLSYALVFLVGWIFNLIYSVWDFSGDVGTLISMAGL